MLLGVRRRHVFSGRRRSQGDTEAPVSLERRGLGVENLRPKQLLVDYDVEPYLLDGDDTSLLGAMLHVSVEDDGMLVEHAYRFDVRVVDEALVCRRHGCNGVLWISRRPPTGKDPDSSLGMEELS